MSENTKPSRGRLIAEGAVMVALATVLSLVKVWQSPYGGSVTILSMAPIILLSVRRGVKVGLFAGLAHGLIQLIFGLSNIAWIPTPAGIAIGCLADYILPFTLLGLGGCFRNIRFSKNRTANLILTTALGALLVTVLRYVCHLFTGVVVWYALDLEWYADDPTHIVNLYGPWLFSLVYNGIYMIPEIIATTVVTPILAKALDTVKK